MSVSSENGADNEQDLLKSFLHSLDNPDQELLSLFVQGNDSLHPKRRELQNLCQVLFNRVESLGRVHARLVLGGEQSNDDSSVLSGLDSLIQGDAETLWGQVELQNQALHSILKKNIKQLSKGVETRQDPIRLLDMGEIMSDDDNNDGDDGSSSEEEDEDEETRRIRERMERAMEDMDEDDSDMPDDEHDERRASNTKSDEEESLEDPAADELNDGFFDINEMEAFADEEEDYLPQDTFGTVKPEQDDNDEPKKSFHQRQREGDVESGGHDSDDSDEDDELAFKAPESAVKRRKYRQDSEIEALYKLYQEAPENDEGDDSDDDVVNMTAADFFGKPNKKYYEKWNSRKQHQQRKSVPKVDMNDDDADSWDNHDFNDEGPGWRDEEQEEPNSKKVTSGDDQIKEYDDEGGDEEEEAEDEHSGTKETPKAASSSSSHARHAEKLRQQTEQLEKELIAEKPWQMTGESKGTSRPVNSLLDATPEFEVATKMAPLITVEHTANLEDVIKRRILNEDWDDVVPRELPDVAWNKKRGELPEVSQEKSKLGLGELYEREYLKKAAGYDVDAAEKQTEEQKAKSEMKVLFANLCSKLDALSNYHFAPRPVADEAEVRAVTTPAIAMEEVLPLHVSDARGVAPEEVYDKKKGRDGVLRGDTELNQAERKRLRNAKKAARRKARKAKLADEKLISRLESGLGLNNPYEKRKMRQELEMARSRGKVTVGEQDFNADYGASGKFFERMQQQVQQDIGQDGNAAKKRKVDHHGSKKSSSYKL